MADYYSILGVDRSASEKDLKKAYRKMARKYHPDVNEGDESAAKKIQEINKAYKILSDPEKRKIYDQYGEEGLEAFGNANAQGHPGGAGHYRTHTYRTSDFGDMFGDLNDMFGDFFGGGRRSGSRSTRARQGDDIQGRITVTFEEAFKGVKKRITVSRSNLCDRCKGNGAEPGHSKKTCPSCQGTGQVKVSQGFFTVAQVCPTCKGEGRIVEKPCSSCSGTGYVKDKKKVEVPVPAGINDGQRIRIGGEGNAGINGGPRGDVYVEIKVKPHEIFERRGDDIYIEYPVTYTQLVLGDSVDVPTMDGKVSMKIPAGTQPATRLRLKKKGFPSIQKVRRGDQFVILKLEVPRNISGEHKRKIKELKSFDSELKERPFLKDFMNKVKGLFS